MNDIASENRNDTSNDRLVMELRSLGGMEPGDDFTARVMGRIGSGTPRRAADSPARRLVRWLVSPRTVRMSPLGGLAAAACLLLVLGLAARIGGVMDRGAPEGLSPVKFVLAAPGASEVAVIGSFNGWNAAGWNMRRDKASGLWTLSTALPAGSHEYVFLIDGATTMPDAAAALSADDGFGSRNSILLVKNGDCSLL